MTQTETKLQLIGGGKMGQALLHGLLRTGWADAHHLVIVEVNADQRSVLAEAFPGVTITETFHVGVDTVVAVKPHIVASVCEQLVDPSRIVSIAAGIKIETIQQIVGDNVAVMRVMPNTPALVGEGVSAVAGSSSATEQDIAWASQVMSSVGPVVTVDESQLDAVTGLSGSGPAYVFAMAEALVEAGIAAGLAPDIAETLAFQTLYGSARLLHESELGPAALREQVTTPGGTTAAGLAVLTEQLPQIMVDTIAAATARSIELGNQ